MPQNVRYRVGLAGAGQISEYHGAAVRRVPNAELMGVYDVDIDRAGVKAAESGVRAFDSLAAMREAGCDVVHVLTPPDTHAAVALEALELGCHVLIEKPLACDVDDCRKVQERAKALGLQACVDHSLLFDPQVRRALDMARSGRLGRIVSVDILRSSAYPPYPGGPLPPQYRSAGYPFRDLGIHALYLFQAFLGPIENVRADWASLGGEPNLAFDEWRAQVHCRDGLGQFQLSWNVKPMQSQMIVQGTRGVLRVDLFLMFAAMRAHTGLPKPIERMVNAFTDCAPPLIESPRNAVRFVRGKIRPYHGLQDLVGAFYRALADGDPMPAPVDDAIAVVDWTERVARAAERDYECRIKAIAPRKVGEATREIVLVTGASGGLGSAIVDRLVAGGTCVRVFARRIPKSIPDGVEVVIGDLGDPDAVDRAVDGATTVIHAGAAMSGGWPDHQRATVVGTKNLLSSCEKHGVTKLVHISSMSVVDWAGAPDGSPISETTACEPRPDARGYYTRAKLEAEQSVAEAAKTSDLSVVIIRPGQIFGRRIPLVTPAVARRAGKRWLVLGDGLLTLPLVYIDDVVDSVLLAMDRPLPSGQILQIVDPVSLTQADVLQITHKDAKVVRIPRGVVFAGGRISELLLGLMRRQSPFSVYRLKSAMARRTFSCDLASSVLGWEPRVGVCAGIRRVISNEEEACGSHQ
jgi:predicted dehydrogenase/nucleoside-diphosphate-sugar epimerase